MLKTLIRLPRRIVSQLTRRNFHKAIWYFREYGLGQFWRKVVERAGSAANAGQEQAFDNVRAYREWIAANEPTVGQLEAQSKHKFKFRPKISIVVPVFNTPLAYLEPMIKSVKSQTYPNWELCLADGSSQLSEARHYLRKLTGEDSRIKIKLMKINEGIAGNTNAAIELASGQYIAFLDHDDTLAPFAIDQVVNTLNATPAADLLYSDEDKLSRRGRTRLKPHFKPDWSPDNLRSYNYVTHLLVIKRRLLNQVGRLREGFEGSQDFDLVLRASEKAKKIVHIPHVLYHWREHQNSTALNTDSKSSVPYSTKRAVAEHLNRLGLRGRVVDGPFFGSCRALFSLPAKLPLVSIIIPTKDQSKFLQRCLQSIINRSTYPSYEIILVDTGSRESATQTLYTELKKYPQMNFLDKRPRIRIIDWKKPFNFSAVNNFAAREAKGEYLLFLNNDTEVINGDWIEAMMEFAQRPDVGAVGAKLLYPNNSIQHGGVILGIGGVAGHSHKYFPSDSHGYFGRLVVPQNLSAVTAACAMVPRQVFTEVGGFDEGYAVAFNDIDLCLKIRQSGKLVIWTPYAQLYHYESMTRGYEDTAEKQVRFKSEIDRFMSKWKKLLESGDQYYTPNLTLEHEDFSLKLPDDR